MRVFATIYYLTCVGFRAVNIALSVDDTDYCLMWPGDKNQPPAPGGTFDIITRIVTGTIMAYSTNLQGAML